jgi:hypothetical protein
MNPNNLPPIRKLHIQPDAAILVLENKKLGLG